MSSTSQEAEQLRGGTRDLSSNMCSRGGAARNSLTIRTSSPGLFLERQGAGSILGLPFCTELGRSLRSEPCAARFGDRFADEADHPSEEFPRLSASGHSRARKGPWQPVARHGLSTACCRPPRSAPCGRATDCKNAGFESRAGRPILSVRAFPAFLEVRCCHSWFSLPSSGSPPMPAIAPLSRKPSASRARVRRDEQQAAHRCPGHIGQGSRDGRLSCRARTEAVLDASSTLNEAAPAKVQPGPARHRTANRRLPFSRYARRLHRLRRPGAGLRSDGSDRFLVSGPFAAAVPSGPDNLVYVRPRPRAPHRNAALPASPHHPGEKHPGRLRARRWLQRRGRHPARASTGTGSSAWASSGCADTALVLGADLPMCLAARPVRASGIGEILEPVSKLPALDMVLINPGIEVATPAVFAALERRDSNPLPAPPHSLSRNRTARLAGLNAQRPRSPLPGRSRRTLARYFPRCVKVALPLPACRGRAPPVSACSRMLRRPPMRLPRSPSSSPAGSRSPHTHAAQPLRKP